MSVFRVKLNNTQQGLLDFNPATASPIAIGGAQGTTYLGQQMNPSKQRTIFVAGPHRIYRELFDGQTFTDCNYWKRFAFPQVPLDQAFIEVVTDDGSVWSDFSDENNYALTFGGDVPYTVAVADTFATKFIDLIGTYGSYATFVQITNYGTLDSQDIKVQLNGSTSAVFNLKAGDTQVFNMGDLQISKLAFDGGTADTDIQIVLSLTTQCNT
jgi:hypothetical protein